MTTWIFIFSLFCLLKKSIGKNENTWISPSLPKFQKNNLFNVIFYHLYLSYGPIFLHIQNSWVILDQIFFLVFGLSALNPSNGKTPRNKNKKTGRFMMWFCQDGWMNEPLIPTREHLRINFVPPQVFHIVNFSSLGETARTEQNVQCKTAGKEQNFPGYLNTAPWSQICTCYFCNHKSLWPSLCPVWTNQDPTSCF